MAEVVLNGKGRRVAGGETLAGLIQELGLDARWVIAEFNGEPLPRDRFPGTVLADGDRIELVRAVAGG
jgi:sulfur carrier protein